MYQDNRPLETLAAYALTFVSGMLAAAALAGYTGWIKKRVREEVQGASR